MRIDLCVPFNDNRECKSYGGRWDAARQTWYVIDPPDMRPLMKWLPQAKYTKAGHKGSKQHRKPVQHASRPVTTPMHSDGSIPDCGCQDVAPWSHCVHSDTGEIDDEQLAHLRSIMAA